MKYDREDPERYRPPPSAEEQVSGLSLFAPPAPLPEDTRRAAREAMEERLPRLRTAVLATLRQRPRTADEVAEVLGESILAIRPRVTELHH
ncbi:MAG: hypothetical protein IPK12_23325, partial [Gemmatimonadetes bacterium]|nr:hypothetical protein [Gemmatimonadota bacterium]